MSFSELKISNSLIRISTDVDIGKHWSTNNLFTGDPKEHQ